MLIVILLLQPAIMTLLPFPRERETHSLFKKGFLDPLLRKIIDLNLHHQKITLPIIALIALFGIAGILRIRVETNPVGYFKEDTPVSQRFHDIYQDMAGSFPLNVVLDSKTEDFFEGKFSPSVVAAVPDETFDVSFSICPTVDAPNTVIRFIVPDALVKLVEGDQVWMGDVEEGETVTLTLSLATIGDVEVYVRANVEAYLSGVKCSSSYYLKVATPFVGFTGETPRLTYEIPANATIMADLNNLRRIWHRDWLRSAMNYSYTIRIIIPIRKKFSKRYTSSINLIPII